MVASHLRGGERLTPGIAALPEVSQSLSATQAAYRFLHHPDINLRQLAAPLLKLAHAEIAESCRDYALIIHDWSQLPYRKHSRKQDRVAMSVDCDLGYKLQVALAMSDHEGGVLAPVQMRLYAADGVHCSSGRAVAPRQCPLDEVTTVLADLEDQRFSKPLVHLIDAEANSVDHLRQWSRVPGRCFVVRTTDRLVKHGEREQKCSHWQAELHAAGAFQASREVEYHGRPARQLVAELAVELVRPAYQNRGGKRYVIPGQPLAVRLIISEVRDPVTNDVLATWWLLTNLPLTVSAATVALWYYWRWRIESFFKLLKSAGLNLEDWRQQSADAVARRLLVACMACMVVWRLARDQTPTAQKSRRLLVKLSGRTMARGVEFTLPALLAGLWVLLATLHTLETTNLDELRQLANFALPTRPRKPP